MINLNLRTGKWRPLNGFVEVKGRRRIPGEVILLSVAAVTGAFSTETRRSISYLT